MNPIDTRFRYRRYSFFCVQALSVASQGNVDKLPFVVFFPYVRAIRNFHRRLGTDIESWHDD